MISSDPIKIGHELKKDDQLTLIHLAHPTKVSQRRYKSHKVTKYLSDEYLKSHTLVPYLYDHEHFNHCSFPRVDSLKSRKMRRKNYDVHLWIKLYDLLIRCGAK